MAYAYQQNLNGGASRGYIKYNVTPAIGQPIGVGDTLSINGEMYISNQTTRSFSLMFGYLGVNTDAGNPGWLRDAYTVLTIAKTCNKGKKAYFSITYKVEEALLTGGTLASGVSAPGGTPDENGLFNLYMCFSMNWSGGPIWSLGNNNHRFRAIAARRAPTAGTPVLTDLYGEVSGGQTPLEYFGGYVQGESLPRLTAAFATDGRDTKLNATHVLDITGGTPAQDLHLSVQTAAGASEVIFDLPALDCSGTLTYAYTVTDSAGLSGEPVTGTLTVLAYSPPDISAFSLQRYKSVIGQGDVAADDGTRLWFTYTGTVQAVAGLNAWTLKLDYEVQDSGSPATQAITGGADGAVASYANSKLLYDAYGLTFSSASAWTFTAILSDLFNTTQRVVNIIKAGAYFNVEKNGVAVGQRSTGSANDKRFEVASDYTSILYGGLDMRVGGIDVTDQFTISKTAGKLTISSFKAYKCGPLIFFQLNCSMSGVTTPGNSVFEGTISGPWLPSFHLCGMSGFWATSIEVFFVDTAGNVTLRAMVANDGPSGSSSWSGVRSFYYFF